MAKYLHPDFRLIQTTSYTIMKNLFLLTVSPLVTMEHIIIRYHMSIDDYLIRERYVMMGYHVTIDRH